MRGTPSVIVGTAMAIVTLLPGCAPSSMSESTPSSAATMSASVTFEAVVDGDTIETTAGTVRIIGIDAPERGACGYAEASVLVSSLLSQGDPVNVELPDGQNDQDRHGRLLRYVETEQGEDVAVTLLTAGLAVARYDSTDGYPAHPRESDYRAAQVATLTADGSVVTAECQKAADAAEAEERARIAA